MTNATKNTCRNWRSEAIDLGFTRQQFDSMVRVAYGWTDVRGWRDAALTVRNTCLYWGSVEKMKASGCHLSKVI